jgi:hypothetical protein
MSTDRLNVEPLFGIAVWSEAALNKTSSPAAMPVGASFLVYRLISHAPHNIEDDRVSFPVVPVVCILVNFVLQKSKPSYYDQG